MSCLLSLLLALPLQAAKPKASAGAPAAAAVRAPAVRPIAAQLTQAGAAANDPKSDPATVVAQLFDAARLSSPNPVSATTLAEAGVTAVHLDAGRAARGETAAIAKAVRHKRAAVIGRFSDPRDLELKPKLDEGLAGAVLEKAESLKDVLRFLRRLYLPPLGDRSVGPSEATAHLARAKDFIANNNRRFFGGISISTEKGALNAGSLLLAKARGLKFVELGEGLSAAAAEFVKTAALAAGVPAIPAPRRDTTAVEEAFARYADVPAASLPRTTELGFLMSPDRAMARALQAGAGAVFIDAEAGQFTHEKVLAIIRDLPRGTAFVRAVEWNDPRIVEYIREGAAGVIAPQIQNERQAAAFVSAVKRADPRAEAIVIVETRRGLENVERIAAVDGLDVLFVGPNDLSVSMGVGQGSPAFLAAVARIEAAAAASYVALGGLSKSRSETQALYRRGYRFLATVGDQPALAAFFRRP